MRFNFASALVVALAADAAVASTWFGKAVYNKWHETELERWLSDHDIPYPTPADRKDLENLVKDNWNSKVAQPYNSWDTQQLQSYLSSKGHEAKKGAEQNKDSLLASVKAYWYETEDQANNAYANVRDWIFDSWTDSQLKAFLDRHGIPNPQPRTRDTLLKTARENYQTAANKSWSESELKAWLDERGYPAPQPSTRDKLIASVRRNSRLASDSMKAAQSSASASAASAQQSLTDALLDAWSDSQIKEWLDKNGVKVPQGSKRNELTALARKHRAKLSGDNVSHSAASAYGAATSKAGNQYAQATDDASLKADQAYGAAGYYIDWIKSKLGLAASDASASASSAAAVASSSGSSVASQASKDAKKSGKAATDAATESASAAKHRASEAAQQASDRVKEEL
ncbi:hypothetical protein B0J12DRAFT_669152 [Macrophomina phaseolina]|uniref:Stress-responsive protein Ish1 n=1 Tax=Macrophomina phaseolina TaxID=35725 RepID=A0ABQ8G623_9PEZI|nr:hypothetical protein B0J12DRAFT_669152 [Macrophomina phaseolina]